MPHAAPKIRTSRELIRTFRGAMLLATLVPVLCSTWGCANRAMDATIASWQGQQVSAVVAAWGRPSEELLLDGKQLLIWNTYDGRLAFPGEKKPSSPAVSGYCVRLLKADRSGRIVDGTWDGNDCPGWFSGWRR